MKDYQKQIADFYNAHKTGVITTGLLAASHLVFGHGLIMDAGSVVLSFAAVHFYSQSVNTSAIDVTPKK